MADNHSINLMGAMDLLWFHQTIIFPQPNSVLLPLKPLERPEPISETLPSPSSNTSLPSLFDEEEEEEISPAPSFFSPSEDDVFSNQSEEDDCKEEIPTKLTRSSSQLNQSNPKRQFTSRVKRLHKTRSCKSLLELELEEVKGFMDLGFEFKKENINPQMMSLVPGLQRLGLNKSEQEQQEQQHGDDDEVIPIEEDDRLGVMRPYLSEAWLVKRPDSPLLNMRLPKVSATLEMKKQLRNWARTVASAIHQES